MRNRLKVIVRPSASLYPKTMIVRGHCGIFEWIGKGQIDIVQKYAAIQINCQPDLCIPLGHRIDAIQNAAHNEHFADLQSTARKSNFQLVTIGVVVALSFYFENVYLVMIDADVPTVLNCQSFRIQLRKKEKKKTQRKKITKTNICKLNVSIQWDVANKWRAKLCTRTFTTFVCDECAVV